VGSQSAAAQTAERPSITLVTGIDPSYGLYALAVKKGFFEKEGIDAKLRVFDDGNIGLDSLLTGAAHIGGTTEVGNLVRRSRGGQIFVMASAIQAEDLYGAAGRKEITKPSDLHGKTIGVTKGSGGHLYFSYYAKKFNVDLSKVKVKFVQSPESVAALARGDIDAVFVWEPWVTRVTKLVPGTHVITRTGTDRAFKMNIYMVFAKDLADNRPLAEKAMRALLETAQWIPKNWDESVKIVAETYRMKPEDVSQLMKLVTNNITFDRAEFTRNFTDAGDFAKANGLMATMPDLNAFFRPEVLRSVAPSRVK
jgi:NitT/TauT family transport system substrate-binding protein